MKDDILEKILADNPHTEISYPTQGIIYPKESPLSAGKLHLRYMTGEDEEILTTTEALNDVPRAYSRLLRRLVLNPRFNPDELAVADKNYLILSARVASLGGDYTVEGVTCPHCGHEEKGREIKKGEFEGYTFSLFDIKDSQMQIQPDVLNTNSFSIQLPVTNQVVKLKLITDKDVQEVKSFKPKNATVADFTLTACSYIDSFPNMSKGTLGEKIGFYRKLPTKDTTALREHIRKIDFASKYLIDYTCPKCGGVSEKSIVFDVSFFFPDIR